MKSPVSMYDALISVQVPGDKARAVAEALESDMSVHLATRQDLLLLRKDVDALRKDMDAGFGFVRTEIDVLRKETNAGLASLRKDMDTGLASVRKDMDAGFALVKAEFKQDLTQLTVRLGIMMVGALTLLFAALKLVP